MPKGDPLFQNALAAARRDAVMAFLERQGITASRFVTDVNVEGTQSNVRLDYNVARDDIVPTLNVTWTPPKGTKVKARDRITAKAIAKDDANRWQSGIKTIDLDVQGGGQFGFGDYPRPPQTCENPPPAANSGRRLHRAGQSAADRAAARRHQGLRRAFRAKTSQSTRPGIGMARFKWVHLCTGVTRDETHGIADLTLDYDGRGNLTGTLAGSTPQRSMSYPSCSSFVWVTPGTFSARLIGSYTPTQSAFSVQAVDVRNTWGRASYCGPVVESAFAQIHESPMFGDSFCQLRREPDGGLILNTDI